LVEQRSRKKQSSEVSTDPAGAGDNLICLELLIARSSQKFKTLSGKKSRAEEHVLCPAIHPGSNVRRDARF
jgi:hypothetical protein